MFCFTCLFFPLFSLILLKRVGKIRMCHFMCVLEVSISLIKTRQYLPDVLCLISLWWCTHNQLTSPQQTQRQTHMHTFSSDQYSWECCWRFPGAADQFTVRLIVGGEVLGIAKCRVEFICRLNYQLRSSGGRIEVEGGGTNTLLHPFSLMV